jgi:hypothetical protein
MHQGAFACVRAFSLSHIALLLSFNFFNADLNSYCSRFSPLCKYHVPSSELDSGSRWQKLDNREQNILNLQFLIKQQFQCCFNVCVLTA